jgi:hypothetical protein
LQKVYLMAIRKPVDYLKIARQLTAQRRGGTIAPPAPSIPSRRIDVVRPAAPEPAPEPFGFKGTRKYALITAPDQVAELMTYLGTATRVALDLKTTGLDPRRDRIRLLTLTTEQGSWLLDCFEVDPRPLFPILTEKELVIHDALLYLGFLFQMGFEPGENGSVLDTMLMSQLLEGQHPKDKEDE